jgi:hypothetical protein
MYSILSDWLTVSSTNPSTSLFNILHTHLISYLFCTSEYDIYQLSYIARLGKIMETLGDWGIEFMLATLQELQLTTLNILLFVYTL